MKLKLIVLWTVDKGRNGSRHFEKAVAQELQTLVVVAHSMLEVDAFLSLVVVGVVRVLGDGFQSKLNINI